MRILIATGIFPPDVGGPAMFSQRLAEEFLRLGVQTTVLTYGKYFDYSTKYKIIGVSRRWPTLFRQGVYLGKLFFMSISADGILALDSLGAGFPAIVAGFLLGKRVVIRLGGDFLWEKFVESGRGLVTISGLYTRHLDNTFPILKQLIKFTLRRAAIIVFTTRFLRELFVKHYGINRRCALIIENAYEKSVTKERESPDTPLVIAWAGRFLKLKNLNLLIRVVKRLIDRGIELRLVLIGGGPEKRQIIEEIASSGIADKVAIFPSLHQQELHEKIRTAHCCVLPSLSEVSPNFALECASMGKPVIITKETGIKNQFPHFLYIDPMSEQSLQEAIMQLRDVSYYKNIQKKIADIAYIRSWRVVARDFISLFLRI